MVSGRSGGSIGPIMKARSEDLSLVTPDGGLKRSVPMSDKEGNKQPVWAWSDASMERTATEVIGGDGEGMSEEEDSGGYRDVESSRQWEDGIERRDRHLRTVRQLKRKAQLDGIYEEKARSSKGKGNRSSMGRNSEESGGGGRARAPWIRGAEEGRCWEWSEYQEWLRNLVKETERATREDDWRDSDEDSDPSYDTMVAGKGR